MFKNKVFLVCASIALLYSCNKGSLDLKEETKKPVKVSSDTKFQVFDKRSPHYGKGEVAITFKSKKSKKLNSAGNGRANIESWRDVYSAEITSGLVHASVDIDQLDDFNNMSRNVEYIEIKKPGYMVILLDRWKDPSKSLVFTNVGKHSLVDRVTKKKNAKGQLIQGYTTDFYNRVIITKADAVVAWDQSHRVLAFPGASEIFPSDILNGVDIGHFWAGARKFIASHIIVPPNVTVALYNPNYDPKGNREFNLSSGFHEITNNYNPYNGKGFGYRIKATNPKCGGDVALYGSMFYRGGNVRLNVCTDPIWLEHRSGYDLRWTASIKIPSNYRVDIMSNNGTWPQTYRSNVLFVGWDMYNRKVRILRLFYEASDHRNRKMRFFTRYH